MQIVSKSEAETLDVGRRIGRSLDPPRVVLLEGELGTGKTILARGIAEGMEIDEGVVVHSPSFTLVNEYPSRKGILYHLDLYRLESLRDLYSIGIEDILASDSVVMVEWAEKLVLPVDNPLKIRIAHGKRPHQRHIEIEGQDPASHA